jgi:DeoR/GlpR family transcriptional regulator of sugar metabolism
MSEMYIPSSTERQDLLLAYIETEQRVSVPDIVRRFAISAATARRDLEVLAERGKIRRYHGGALAQREAPPEPPAMQRRSEQKEEKARIGAAAAALVQDGDTVFLSSGTTVLEVARGLRERRGLTVITNSLPVMNMLADLDAVTVLCLGGTLRRSELSFVGPVAEQAVQEVRADKVIIGLRGLDLEHGLTNADLQETRIDRAMIEAAREVIVVADHTKLARASLVRVAPIDRVDILVTDTHAPDTVTGALRERGVQVVCA